MNKNLVLFQNSQYEQESSDAMNLSLLSVLIGASGLEILEAAGHFDFSNKRITNVANPSAAQDVATKDYVDGLVGGSGDFSDSAFRVSDNGDSTKKMAFEVSAIATGTVRTVTMPDANVDLGNIASLVTLSGVAAGEPDLGTFSGAIIPDDSTIKAALQALESEIEALPTPMVYRGVYNATTNSPALADGAGSTGDLYRVSVAGTQDFGSGNITFEVGDMVVYNGATWEKWDVIDAVISVNGQSGVVSLDSDDISEGVTNLYFSDERAQDAIGAMVADSSKVSLTYVDGTPSLTADIVAGSLVNADISASAAIAYSKLDLTGSIVNADINASAAIAYSKLNLTGSIVLADLASLSVDENKLTASVAGAGLAGGAGAALSVNVGDGVKIASDAVARDDAFTKTNDNAGAITVRQVVYVKSDGDVDLAIDSLSALGSKMIGIVEDASIAAAASGKIIFRDGAIIAGYTGLTPGAPVYIGATAGAHTQTAPTASGTSVFKLGMALSATQVLFQPEFVIANA